MHKARVQIREMLPKVDGLIEVLDARIPYSSENPAIAELRGDKPALKVLAKCDLADPELTTRWQEHFEQRSGTAVRAVTTDDIPTIRRLKNAARKLVPDKGERPITLMIVGIPNVGKSTIINILAGKKVAKTGNEPAVTKSQQRINIGDGVTLMDTPGMLWPKVENIASGYRLALIGSVRETAMEYADVGFFTAGFLLEHFRDRLAERYGVDDTADDALSCIEAIGRKRGCLGKNAVVDIDRASRILVTECRSGKLGPLTYETPEMMEREIVETRNRIAAEAEKKEQKDRKRKQKFKERQKDR